MIRIQNTHTGSMTPCTRIYEDGVHFSAVFRGKGPAGLVLIRVRDGEETRVPFPEENRIGALYAMTVSGFDPDRYVYLFEQDGRRFPDPFARSLVTLDTPAGPVKACGFFPGPEEDLPLIAQLPGKPWPDRLYYCLHVKGFTASPSSETARPGTFAGLTEKIPYLVELGVTDLELLPVYELVEKKKTGGTGFLYEKYPSDPRTKKGIRPFAAYDFGTAALKAPDVRDTNFWGFGEGYYEAPKASLSASGNAQKEFADMVRAFHKAGIRIILQMFFPASVSMQDQLRTLRFYVTRYGVDGFHLKGDISSPASFASDPVLSDTDLLYYGFPWDADAGRGPVSHLAEYRDDYMKLLRRFVKSDDYCMADFVREFLKADAGRGQIRFAAGYEGFTLRDLVSFNEKHNEANGEDGRDGESENLSWNCGHEGHTSRLDVRQLRKQQMKNFLCLLFLSQGTPLLSEGDERFNTRDGNNNPWCQDNETGWVDWTLSPDAEEILAFTRAMSAFRKAHPVFRMKAPFRMQDPKGFGFPDLSFHGEEAWRPDLGNHSHTVGILYCENYAEEREDLSLLYLAINTWWEKASLGLPNLPAGYKWDLAADTSLTAGFTDGRSLLPDQHQVLVRPRSIRILRAVWVGIPGTIPETRPQKGMRLPWGGFQPYRHGRQTDLKKKLESPRFRGRVFAMRRS